MKLIKLNLIVVLFLFICVGLLYSVESTKPEDHNSSWLRLHGQSARTNREDCLVCHMDRDDGGKHLTSRMLCIRCHQDTPPRNHTPSWNRRGHGLESRWNRDKCQACHTNVFCMDCHISTAPVDHNGGFMLGTHCYVNCHSGALNETRCFVCHKSYHGPAGPY